MNTLGKTSTNIKQNTAMNTLNTPINTPTHLLFTNTRMGITKEQNIVCLSCKTQGMKVLVHPLVKVSDVVILLLWCMN